jgi:hypothetical protein
LGQYLRAPVGFSRRERVARNEGDPPPAEQPGSSDDVLRAKYFDYCSAQVADLLLQLPPDEIYVLAEEARRRTGASEGRFSDLVWMATEGIRERLVLPTFEVWVEDYAQNPKHYERYFLMWDAEGSAPPTSR